MTLDVIMPEKHEDKPQEIVCIDLGSNSFHLIIARIVNGSLQVLSRLKQHIYLADGLDHNNILSQEAMDRGLNCLAMFAERLQDYPAENVKIVATHTLRVAINSQEFLQQAAKIIPYPIEIISGDEEARLIYLGVAHTQPEKGKRLVIDIGGGSTELALGEGFDNPLTESRKMGSVTFTKLFFPDGQISKRAFIKAQLAAEQQLEKVRCQFDQKHWQTVYGSSGTFKTVNNIMKLISKKEDVITQEMLQKLTEKIVKYKHISELDLPGLNKDRKNIFIGGLAILAGLFNSLHINELKISAGALREGVLYEMEESLFRHHDIRSRTANSLAEHYNIDRQQAERVLTTTKLLYTQWKKQNRELANTQLESLLNWAALLHEVGLSINDYNIHRHSAYILQHSNLPGFSREHQLILATMVRFHRKVIRLEDFPHFTLFKKKEILPLIQLLRLAVLLNKQRQTTSMPTALFIDSNRYHLTLRLPTPYLHNSLMLLDLEREQKYWHEMTGWKLSLATIAD